MPFGYTPPYFGTIADACIALRHCVALLNNDTRILLSPCQLWLLVGVHHWLSGFQPAHLLWPSNLPLVMVWIQSLSAHHHLIAFYYELSFAFSVSSVNFLCLSCLVLIVFSLNFQNCIK
mgnify:CR=1 FL=1